MRRSLAGIWVGAAILLLSGLMGTARAGWEQDTQATIGPMTSQTAALCPADRTRTTVGIGEAVICTIDTDTWSDTDCNPDDPEADPNDSFGGCTWDLAGTQEDNCYYEDPHEYVATLYTGASAGDVTITASVIDSRTKFDDDAATAQLTFTIIEPTGVEFVSQADTNKWMLWESGDKYLGTAGYYTYTIQPTTVSFYAAAFRISAEDYSKEFPSGATYYDGGVSGDFYLGNDTNTWVYPVNSVTRYNLNYLYNGSAWSDFFASFGETLQYKTAGGEYTDLHTATKRIDFYHSSATGVTTYDGESGSQMGPYCGP